MSGPSLPIVDSSVSLRPLTRWCYAVFQPMPLSSLQPSSSVVPPTPLLDPMLPPAAMTALWQGHRIEAIKLVRLEQNIGLYEAEDVIDTYLRSQPALRNRINATQADAREGLLRWLMFLLIGGVGLAYVLT